MNLLYTFFEECLLLQPALCDKYLFFQNKIKKSRTYKSQKSSFNRKKNHLENISFNIFFPDS